MKIRSALDFHSEAVAPGVYRAQLQNYPPGTQETEGRTNTHINGFITEVLDVLRAHVQGRFARHQEH